MKLTKLSLILATFAAIGASAAFADDQQLTNRLAVQRAQDIQTGRQAASVAVYADQRGIGSNAAQGERSDVHFALRFDSHGHTYGSYVAGE